MLDQLDDDALDHLPFGVVALDEALKVVRMNRTESQASGIQRWRAIGRGFFDDIAPARTNAKLEEHIRNFLAGREAAARIAHTFVRRAGTDPTQIELSRGNGRVYLKIRRD